MRRATLAALLVALGCGGPQEPSGEATEPETTEQTQQAATQQAATEQAATEQSGEAGRCSLVGRFTLTDDGQPDEGPNGEPVIGISKDYTFEAETYRMEGYPALTITGHYELSEWDGHQARIAWTQTVFDGEPRDPHESTITFTPDCDGFEMDGMTYARVPTE